MSRRVLIIDDEEDIREVAALSLETVAGWYVLDAGSAAAGIVKDRENHPDAVLLAVMMPGMAGPTTFRELRALPETANIPVILLTAKVQAADQKRFSDLGVVKVMFKTFDPLVLAQE